MSVIITLSLILVLTATALILKFCFTAYDFIAYGLIYAALMTGVYVFCPFSVKLVLTVFTVTAAVPLVTAEILILHEAFTCTCLSPRYVIVLGAAVLGTEPSKALVHRCDAALEFLRSNPHSEAVLSGGKGRGEDISEALAMKIYLTDRGISPDRLYLEDSSVSTSSNLRNSFHILRTLDRDFISGTAVITSPYHMYRAKMLAAALGINVKGYTSKPELTLSDINLFIREAFGTVYAFFKIHFKGDL